MNRSISSFRPRVLARNAVAAASFAAALSGSVVGLAQGPVQVPLPAAPSRSDVQVLPSTPKPFAYGIFVGHNEGGPGQGKLRYAEADAKRAADTLRDLGRYGTADMRVLTAPSPDDVITAIDIVSARLREHRQRGEEAVLIFYFSGHAKANALDLADKELDLNLLRERLRGAPSTLTLVVLDACQSGSFSRAKGVEAARDFSTNSVARLTTRGIAVMASSTSQELSQESDELRSSVFTHHFLVGLRGAGDQDRDGKVTLDEAYRYAYRSTLAATERTAIGGQHVTLETDLSGQGEVPLAFPREAKSRLELPAALAGRVLVQHKSSGSILAEIRKVGGQPTLLALPSGDYEAIVREGRTVRSCGLRLVDDRVTSIDSTKCIAQADVSRAKGDDEVASDASPSAEPAPAVSSTVPPPQTDAPRSSLARPVAHGELGNWALELGFGLTSVRDDAYSRRLRDFGYASSDDSSLRLSGALTRNFGRYFVLGASVQKLPSFTFSRGANDSVEASAFSVAGLGRAVLPLLSPTGAAWLELYAQGSVGAAHSTVTITTSSTSEESKTAPVFGGAAGLAAGGRYGGGFISFGYDHTTAISNRLGDEHNAGGAYVLLGGRLRTH